MLYLVSKHACPARRAEAEHALSRHRGTVYFVGCEKEVAAPVADWNRLGAFALNSLAHVGSCLAHLGSHVDVAPKEAVPALQMLTS